MIAVQGVYDNGRLQLEESAPMKKASVIVIFPEGRPAEKQISEDSARKLFDDFSGSIARDIDEKAERMAAKDEKYAGVD